MRDVKEENANGRTEGRRIPSALKHARGCSFALLPLGMGVGEIQRLFTSDLIDSLLCLFLVFRLIGEN